MSILRSALAFLRTSSFLFNQGLFETGPRLSSSDPEIIRESNIPRVFGRQGIQSQLYLKSGEEIIVRSLLQQTISVTLELQTVPI